MKERLAITKIDLHKKLREEIDSELRIEYLAQLKHQREIVRKELHKEIMDSFQDRIDREVEKRMRENFLEWEEDYKRKKILAIRDAIVREVRDEYETKIEELLKQEKLKMQD